APMIARFPEPCSQPSTSSAVAGAHHGKNGRSQKVEADSALPVFAHRAVSKNGSQLERYRRFRWNELRLAQVGPQSGGDIDLRPSADGIHFVGRARTDHDGGDRRMGAAELQR